MNLNVSVCPFLGIVVIQLYKPYFYHQRILATGFHLEIYVNFGSNMAGRPPFIVVEFYDTGSNV